MIKNDIYIIVVGKIDFRNKKKFPVNRMPEFDFFISHSIMISSMSNRPHDDDIEC
mgnify:CR=1 FL=1